MFTTDSDYLLLSGIQHFQFCRRQWALIHIEQQWLENVKTVEGQAVHTKVDQPAIKEKRGDKIVVRAMPVLSHELRIQGVCDVVEFHRHRDGVYLPAYNDTYTIHVVEYKRGKPKRGKEDIVQLVAQVMCLEEMLACTIAEASLYYDEIRRRQTIDITEDDKQHVRNMVKEMQSYYTRQHTPKVKTGKHCLSCSLESICLPVLNESKSVAAYMRGFM
ncbi:CRISPR-associated protein Cas4 [Caryophanon latum]|uniref:CRISPR-associated exonuclease Cas4 n=1 Tax=Caryophanon latum TaxID=33977 RepID=A0A1C0YSY3_9BACL|nr:CRISPR-associated protein Cas4 [Caryophanon latum]OCS90286.1 CRISPR-associated protein Cas4 [Caryophanon latum]